MRSELRTHVSAKGRCAGQAKSPPFLTSPHHRHRAQSYLIWGMGAVPWLDRAFKCNVVAFCWSRRCGCRQPAVERSRLGFASFQSHARGKLNPLSHGRAWGHSDRASTWAHCLAVQDPRLASDGCLPSPGVSTWSWASRGQRAHRSLGAGARRGSPGSLEGCILYQGMMSCVGGTGGAHPDRQSCGGTETGCSPGRGGPAVPSCSPAGSCQR
ncbi:uncharacterized protein B0I36DRAFT_83183 [Microdochium trichocladiopsis]|uniref:Uncharacterized protein n=1 Tax=Microdochium trichocladiopsis TaxID=1682393 RepID=A0A9P8YD77_9PEZI|nr:uncharacterized protein B0I36DRAFT_83183 [Microdochium trichocladiopsis]KAH7034692.1 hypothetical protein B0I36DRAFT_83183 [Microdochium trichocladiopsis]